MKEKEARSWAKASAYTGLAFILPAAILLCYFAGDYADYKLGTRIFKVVGVMVGFAAGLWETMRQLKQIDERIRTGNSKRGGR